MIQARRKGEEADGLPLPYSDTETVIGNAADYQRCEANDMVVHVPADTEGFTAFTSFDITLNRLDPDYSPVDLLECWIDWPPTEQPADWGVRRRSISEAHQKKLPMIIQEIVGSPDDVEVDLDTDKTKAIVRATKISSSTLRVKFKAPNVFFKLPGRPPFAQKRLTVNIRVLSGAASSVLRLEYPKSIAMRARYDNAEYQSLVLGIDENYFRKTTFFPQRDVHIRYTFGTADGAELSAPGFPPLRAGLALLGFGFTLLLVWTGLFDLAAAAFALSLFPSFVEVFRMRSLFSHSAAIADEVSWERISAVSFGAIHAFALVAVACILLLVSSDKYCVLGFVLGVLGGLLVLAAWALYFLPVILGTYQKYWCDTCERRTWIRKWLPMGLGEKFYERGLTTTLHHGTRHSLCVCCYDELRKEHLEHRDPPEVTPQSGGGHPNSGSTASIAPRPSTRPEVTEPEFLRDSEQEAWQIVLGSDVKVRPLPKHVDSWVIQNLKKMHLEPRFIPSLSLETMDDDVRDHLEILRARYPRCNNVRKLYWELVREGKFNFPRLAGQWIAVEVQDTSTSRGEYLTLSVAARLGVHNDGFNVSWNSIQDAINREKQSILSEIGLPTERTDLRLLEALEWDLMANREGWGTTDTWEWTNTKYCGNGHMRIIVVGNSEFGGAGCMSARSPVNTHEPLGFRVAVILGVEDSEGQHLQVPTPNEEPPA
jgi:hypothetical protein